MATELELAERQLELQVVDLQLQHSNSPTKVLDVVVDSRFKEAKDNARKIIDNTRLSVLLHKLFNQD